MIDLRGSSNSTFGKAARALLVVSVCYFIAYGIAAYARMEPVFVIRMAVLALLLIAVRYLWMHGGGLHGRRSASYCLRRSSALLSCWAIMW